MDRVGRLLMQLPPDCVGVCQLSSIPTLYGMTGVCDVMVLYYVVVLFLSGVPVYNDQRRKMSQLFSHKHLHSQPKESFRRFGDTRYQGLQDTSLPCILCIRQVLLLFAILYCIVLHLQEFLDSFSSGSTSYFACTCQNPIGAGHIWATLSLGSINVGPTGKITQDLKQLLSSIMKHFLMQLMTIKCSNMSLKMDDHMGQILQDGKKVLEMSSTYLHSKSRPAQTVGLGNLSFQYLDYLWFASI